MMIILPIKVSDSVCEEKNNPTKKGGKQAKLQSTCNKDGCPTYEESTKPIL